MRICKFVSLIFYLFSSFAWASAAKDPNYDYVSQISVGDGVDFTIYTKAQRSQKRISDLSAYLNSKSRMVKHQQGKLIYDFTFSLDENGFRTSSASFQPNKSKHVLVIDASVAFGEGLNDDETITHLINLRSRTYEAYQLGFMGSPPQTNWLLFKKNFLAGKLIHKKGLAIIIGHDQESRRLEGTLDHLSYSANSPLLTEKTDGEFEYMGSFAQSGSLLQKAATRYCIPFYFCKNLMTKAYVDPTEDQLKKLARLYISMGRMYREQFDVEDVIILWTGDKKKIQELTKMKTISISFESYDGGHPNAKGARQIVDYLFDKKIID